MGRVVVLLVYWAMIIGFMTDGAIIKDVNFWERLGFRNAWVTVTQLPLLYLLAGKSSVLGLIAGTSYERLNWLHRWVARTMFVTASVHGWHFFQQYEIAGISEFFFEVMPMGKYGIGAWALLGWTVITGFAPLRHAWYELFVVQHIVTSILFLWVIYEHIPSYAMYNLWFAIAALCFDRFYRTVMLVWQNVKFRAPKASRCKGGQRIGHHAQLRAVGSDITVVTLKDVHFKWRAGQHLYLWIPQIAMTEHHPYTIACAHSLPETCICNSIQIVVRRHDGFSKRLHAYAERMQKKTGGKKAVTAYVTGPYGAPPRWDVYETLVLISASTGTSFTLPILENVLQTKTTHCTKRIDFLLAAKKGDEIDYYVQRLHELIDRAREVGIELKVHIAVTGPATGALPFAEKGDASSSPPSEKTSAVASDVERSAAQTPTPRLRRSTASADSHVHHGSTRPDIEAYIRAPVEESGGETAVVVCGGKAIVARVRNSVAKLSDERAVHKGTGAQGIFLHVEEYCF
jgi:NAD(P)H-flavin reductase